MSSFSVRSRLQVDSSNNPETNLSRNTVFWKVASYLHVTISFCKSATKSVILSSDLWTLQLSVYLSAIMDVVGLKCFVNICTSSSNDLDSGRSGDIKFASKLSLEIRTSFYHQLLRLLRNESSLVVHIYRRSPNAGQINLTFQTTPFQSFENTTVEITNPRRQKCCNLS